MSVASTPRPAPSAQRHTARSSSKVAARGASPSGRRRSAGGGTRELPLATLFPVLAAPERTASGLPEAARRLVRYVDRGASRGLPFADGEGARRLTLPGAAPAWVMPSREGLCMVWTERFGAARTQDALECVKAARARAGHLIASWTSLPGEAQVTHVLGVLPTPSAGAALELANGRLQRLSVADGAYAVSSPSPLAVRYGIRGERHRVLVPQVARGSTGPAGL